MRNNQALKSSGSKLAHDMNLPKKKKKKVLAGQVLDKVSFPRRKAETGSRCVVGCH